MADKWLVGFVLAACIALSAAGTGEANSVCNSNSDCDEQRGFITLSTFYLYLFVGTGVIGAVCNSNSDCDEQRESISSTNGVAATCTSGNACQCPSGTYTYSYFLCVENTGTTANGGVCTAQSQCASGNFCSRCPGVLSGNSYCFTFSGSTIVRVQYSLVFLTSLLATCFLIKMK
ncbi:hypothetical protein KUTeg_011955 [Tegillarca granosa]|uniref:Uncharacterized protein n=1 Tax=Tegillarca granosa TaxID=220873 RepID=A0ABQ9F1R9_TEGGR|nr:hypothetical protein KUTeg_011955 [Tegillarca granosa]